MNSNCIALRSLHFSFPCGRREHGNRKAHPPPHTHTQNSLSSLFSPTDVLSLLNIFSRSRDFIGGGCTTKLLSIQASTA